MKIIKLGEIAKIDISNVDKKVKETDSPVILCNFVDVYHNWAITNDFLPNLMKSTANINQISRFSIHKGQVAITKDSETRDDIGVSAYIADNLPNGVLGYHCALITPDENLLTGKYLNVILHTPYAQKYFELNASGSGQRYTLTVDIIAGFSVPVPDIKTQHIVGDFYSAIDKKLSTNNRINTELESMAKTIYDYWFTQFDFPDKNGKPYKSSGGKMVWNEELKREIPEGWKATSIGSILGDYPKTASILRDDYGLGSKYPIIDQSKDYICGYTDDYDNVLHMNDAIVYGDHTNYTKYVNFDFARGADGTQIINSNEPALPNYILYQQILLLPIIEKGYSRHFKFLKEQYVIVPEFEVSKKYMDMVEYSLLKAKEIITENQQLTSLRDWLLPMLMNGQVGFEEVE